jgi:hypothetical protein
MGNSISQKSGFKHDGVPHTKWTDEYLNHITWDNHHKNFKTTTKSNSSNIAILGTTSRLGVESNVPFDLGLPRSRFSKHLYRLKDEQSTIAHFILKNIPSHPIVSVKIDKVKNVAAAQFTATYSTPGENGTPAKVHTYAGTLIGNKIQYQKAQSS